ncbi:hypothetical protein V8F33_009316 [Rhypophila sp. PSN 637]
MSILSSWILSCFQVLLACLLSTCAQPTYRKLNGDGNGYLAGWLASWPVIIPNDRSTMTCPIHVYRPLIKDMDVCLLIASNCHVRNITNGDVQT